MKIHLYLHGAPVTFTDFITAPMALCGVRVPHPVPLAMQELSAMGLPDFGLGVCWQCIELAEAAAGPNPRTRHYLYSIASAQDALDLVSEPEVSFQLFSPEELKKP